VQNVPASNGVTVDHSDHGLGDRADCFVHVEHIQPRYAVLADVSGFSADFLVAAGADYSDVSTILGFVAVMCATINVVGGFMVTNRMLEMIAGRRRKGGK
jgi:hypothetical protein